MPIKVLTIFDERVTPPGYYRHLQRLPKRRRAEFIRRTSWSGFDHDQDSERSLPHAQGPPDRAGSAALGVDQEVEDEVRAIWLSEQE